MPELFILLPVHRRREVTRRFVTCLAAQRYRGYRLVLLDDGSEDGTAEMVRLAIPGAVVLAGRGDWWWAGALQHGVDWLTARGTPDAAAVLLVNDDTEFAPDFLECGLALLAAHPRTLVLATAFDRATGRQLDAGVHVDWRRLSFAQAARPEEVNCLSTRGLFLRLGDLRALGGFRPRLLPHYASDYEFTIRAHRRGWRLLTDPTLRLLMDPGTSGERQISASSFGDFLRRYFSRRSVRNPLTWTAFILLACPWRWKARHLAYIWWSAARTVGAQAVRWTRRNPGC